MNMKLELLPAYRIAYIRKSGPYGTGNVQTMEKLKGWAKSNDLFHDRSIILGIAHDDPESTRPEDCRYDTCFVLSKDDFTHDDEIKQGVVAGGSYAVFQIDHTAEAVTRAWSEIFPELSNRGHRFDPSRSILERYIPEMIKQHYCEICIPVY